MNRSSEPERIAALEMQTGMFTEFFKDLKVGLNSISTEIRTLREEWKHERAIEAEQRQKAIEIVSEALAAHDEKQRKELWLAYVVCQNPKASLFVFLIFIGSVFGLDIPAVFEFFAAK